MESDNSKWSDELAGILRELADGQGIFLERLPVGSQIDVTTQNSTYTFRLIDAHAGRVIMVGQNKFFTDGEQCTFVGSMSGEAVILVHWLGVHMRLTLANHHQPAEYVLTSPVATIRIHPPLSAPARPT